MAVVSKLRDSTGQKDTFHLDWTLCYWLHLIRAEYGPNDQSGDAPHFTYRPQNRRRSAVGSIATSSPVDEAEFREFRDFQPI